MTLRTKIISGYLAIIVVTGFVSVIAIENYIRVTSLYEEISNRYFRIGNVVNELAYRISQRQVGLQSFLLTGKTRYLMVYDENIIPIKMLIKKANDLGPGVKSYSQLVERYEGLVQKWEDNIAETGKELRRQLDYGLIGDDIYIIAIAKLDGQGRSILRELKAVEGQLQRIAEKEVISQSNIAATTRKNTRNFLILIGINSILISLTFGLILSNHIISALNRVVRAAEVISAGSLTHRIPFLDGKSELDSLARSFNQMAERLDEHILVLRESEKKYSTLVENANDGIIIIQDEKYIFSNRAFLNITGYDPDELADMFPLNIVAPESRDMLKERYTKKLMGEEVPTITEARFISKDGTIKHLEINTATIEYKGKKAGLVILRDITERRSYEERLRKLSNQIIRTQEEERKRIAYELHDEVGQTLATININLELLRMHKELLVGSDYASRICEDTKNIVTKSIDDIHRISYNLRPYLLDNLGLVPALRSYTKDFQERTGVEANLQIEGDSERLAPPLETLVYRIAQEALTNVFKHAKAGRVSILFSCHFDAVKIVIEDDGKGFEVEDVLSNYDIDKRGLGIFGMRERVLAFGGTFTVVPVQPRGTRLIVKFDSPMLYRKAQDGGGS